MTTPDDVPTPPPLPPGPRATPLTVVSFISLATAGGIGGMQLVGEGHRVPAILGTVSSWISAGGIMGILALLVWLQLGNRKIGVDERVAMNADKADVRDHYAEEVTTLRARFDEASERHSSVVTELEARHTNSVLEIEGKYRRLLHETEEHYQGLLRETEEAHEICKRDRDALREEIGQLRDEIRGLRDQIRTQATDRVLRLGETIPPSPAVTGAAKRVRKIVRRGERARGADKAHKS